MPSPLNKKRFRRRKTGEGALLLTGLLMLATVAVLTGEARARPGEECIAREFQNLVHGTGLGPAVDLSGCAFAFDPRIAGRCTHDLGPLPLGGTYCPYHSLSLFPYPALETGGPDAHPH